MSLLTNNKIINSANYNRATKWNNTNGNVTTVGTNGGQSFYGTYDQGGNIFEWNDLDGISNSLRGFRGGSWKNSVLFRLSSSFRFEIDTVTKSRFFGFRVASNRNPLGLSNFVYVGNINNANDSTGYGSVSYIYTIGTYPVTNNEYVEFLNSVAKTDTYSLYNTNMGSDARGGITRSGTSGSYSYSVKTNMGNKPVVYVSWFDCARYCNWLHNSKRTGSQDNTTTENGVYTLNGIITGNAVARNNGARYHMSTENEWYKAAYYAPDKNGSGPGYWKYATQSDSDPVPVTANSAGDGVIPASVISPKVLTSSEDSIKFLIKTPFNVMALPDDTKVYLAWNIPSEDLTKENISNYVVQYSSDNGNTWTTFNKPTSQNMSCVVSGLTNNISYIFRVALTNHLGTGSYSDPSEPVVPSNSSYNAYVALSDNTIGYISESKNPIVESLSIGEPPTGIAVNKNTNKIYVSHGKNISVIDLNSKAILKKISWTSDILSLVLNTSTNQIYGIAGNSTNSIVIINGNTDTISGTININNSPFDIDVNNVTNRLYVTSNSTTSSFITTIDCNTNTVLQTLSLINSALFIKVNSATNKIYVSHDENTSPQKLSLSVINGNTNTLIKNLPISNRADRAPIAINTLTNKVYVIAAYNIFVVDGETDTFLETIDNIPSIFTFASSFYADIDETLNRLYYTASMSGHLIVFDCNTKTFLAGLLGKNGERTGVVPSFNQFVVDSSSNLVYGTYRGYTDPFSLIHPDNKLMIIDAKNIARFNTMVAVGSNPRSIDFNRITNKIYVANSDSKTISVVDSVSGTVIKTIAVEAIPRSLVINKNTNKIYVFNNDSVGWGINKCLLTTIDGSSDTIVDTLDITSDPIQAQRIALNTLTNKLYVPSNKGIYIIDTANNTILKNISIPDNLPSLPIYPAINYITNEIYVTGPFGNTVLVINGSNDTISKRLAISEGFTSGIFCNSLTNQTYVSRSSSSFTATITGETKDVAYKSFGTGNLSESEPDFIGINPNTNKLYIVSRSSTLIIVDENGVATQDVVLPTTARVVGGF